MKRIAYIVALIMLAVSGWAQSYPLGWTNTGLAMPACQSNDYSIATKPGVWNNDCKGMFAYSGALWDSKRGYMVQWGGGHGDYGGNELASISSTAYSWLTAPTIPGIGNCTNDAGNGNFDIESIPPASPTGTCTDQGTAYPNSRHTYMGLTYMPTVDKYFLYGQSLASAVGYRTDRFWTFDPNSKTFALSAKIFPNRTGIYTGGLIADWDATDGVVYVANSHYFFKYNPASDTLTQLSASGVGWAYSAGGFDTLNRRLVIFDPASSKIYHWSTAGSLTDVTSGATDCTAMLAAVNSNYAVAPAVAYDRRHGDFVIWPPGSSTVYFYNSATTTCTSRTDSGAPSASTAGGYGRFRAAPQICPGCFLVVNSPTQVYVWRRDATSENLGIGCTTAFHIDHDCDGYGVGSDPEDPDPLLGRDADDSDVGIQTAAEGIAQYGTIAGFLQHLGYNASGNLRSIATTGADSGTCDLASPCATFAYVSGLGLAANDIVLWRAGTYSEGIQSNYDSYNGTSGNPIVLMAYPGETVIFDKIASGVISLSRSVATHDIVLDGFIAQNSDSAHNGHGIDGAYWSRVTVRHVEGRNLSGGLFAMQDLHDLLIENNVLHTTDIGSNQSHNVYLGARDLHNTNITFRNNLLYHSGLTCFQHNGGVTNLQVDGNICRSYPVSGISLERGTSSSFVRNNLVFGGASKAFVFYNYPSIGAGYEDHDQKNNLVENNTFVIPAKNYLNGSDMGTVPCIAISQDEEEGNAKDLSTGNVFRNNLCANGTSGASSGIEFVQTATSDYVNSYECNGPNPDTLADPLTWDHNLAFLTSNTYAMRLYNIVGSQHGACTPQSPIDSTLTFAQWQSYNDTTTANASGNPLFRSNLSADWASPAKYNFDLLSGSPAIAAGSGLGAPTTDIRGIARSTPPSIGAYETAYTAPPPPTAPSVSLTAPTNGATVSGASVSITATCTPGTASLTGVTFAYNGNVIATDSTAPFATVWNTTLIANASYNLTATCTDTNGLWATSSTVAVTVNNAGPPPPPVGMLVNGVLVTGSVVIK